MLGNSKQANDEGDTFENMARLCKGLGIPDELIDEDIFLYIPLCFIEVYTNGEFQTHHAPPEDRRLVEWFGDLHCGEGRFVQELAAVRDGKRQLDGVDLDALQGGCAYLLARDFLVTGEGYLPPIDTKKIIPSPVRIEGSNVCFGGNYGQGEYCERLKRPINSILALDPGIRAIHMIDQQLQLYRTNPASLFQYAAINRHPFMARLLSHYCLLKCRQLSGDDKLADALSKHELFRSLQGEIADVTQKLIDDHQRKKQRYDFLDLILYTGYLPPKISLSSAQQVLKNAYQLLHPGGALLLGFPLIDSPGGYKAMQDFLLIATSVGFPINTSRVHVGTSNMANDRLPIFAFLVK